MNSSYPKPPVSPNSFYAPPSPFVSSERKEDGGEYKGDAELALPSLDAKTHGNRPDTAKSLEIEQILEIALKDADIVDTPPPSTTKPLNIPARSTTPAPVKPLTIRVQSPGISPTLSSRDDHGPANVPTSVSPLVPTFKPPRSPVSSILSSYFNKEATARPSVPQRPERPEVQIQTQSLQRSKSLQGTPTPNRRDGRLLTPPAFNSSQDIQNRLAAAPSTPQAAHPPPSLPAPTRRPQHGGSTVSRTPTMYHTSNRRETHIVPITKLSFKPNSVERKRSHREIRPGTAPVGQQSTTEDGPGRSSWYT